MRRFHRDLFPALAVSALLAGCGGTPIVAEPPPREAQGNAQVQAEAKVEVKAEAEALRFADEFVLSNQAVTLSIAPSVGRIVGLRPTGGEDLMWRTTPEQAAEGREQNKWVNLGGDKVWPALQAMWGRYLPHGGSWPPDPALDGSVWEVLEQGDRHAVIRSPVAPELGIRITRRIELDESEPRVVIRNRIERVERSIFPVHIWSVSQLDQPKYALLGVTQRHPQGPQGHELHAVWDSRAKDKVSVNVTPLAEGRAVRWDFAHKGGGKVGSLGTWCAAVYDDWMVVHQTAFDPAGSYPDASNMQTYTHGEYIELETLGPQSHPQPGEAIQNTVIWTLIPVEGRDAAALLEAIKKLPAP